MTEPRGSQLPPGLNHCLNATHAPSYAATAISPWVRSFFNAQQVYEYSGFSKFITLKFMRPEL